MLEVTKGETVYDQDGTRLLFIEDIAARMPVVIPVESSPGRTVFTDVTVDGRVLAAAGTEITGELAGRLAGAGVSKVTVSLKPQTIRFHDSAARRARRRHRPAHFPPPDRYVWRTSSKSDGNPVRARTPMWREPKAMEWVNNRLGPRGRPRKLPAAG